VDAAIATDPQLRSWIAKTIRGSFDPDTHSVTDPRRYRLEQTTTGIDEFLQGIGDDPFRSLAADGLRVPAFTNTPSTRFLFQACTINVPRNMRVRLLGRRQMLTLGVVQAAEEGGPTRLIELLVRSPVFRLPDANASWHLMKIPPRTARSPRRFTDSDNFVFRFAESGSALVYEAAAFPPANVNPFGRPDFYTTLTAYTPPNGGRPYGSPLLPAWHGVRNPWDEPHSADWQGLEVNGPATVIDYISVLQTANGGEPAVVQSANPNNLQIIGSREEAFLAEYPGLVSIFRVGSAIQYEVL
jgi:hypothetical protein